MVYIPDEWFFDVNNKDIVFKLFENISDTDVICVDEDSGWKKVGERLSELGEQIILDKYNEGYFVTG